MSPAQGHCGFYRLKLGQRASVPIGAYFHYLHHTHFECNYGSSGTPVLDMWFGTFHDGSEEAEARMNERFMRRAAS